MFAAPREPAGSGRVAGAGRGRHDLRGRRRLEDRGADARAPGTEDNVVDPRNAEVLAERIPGARVELLEGTGHLFFWEQPGEVVRIVREFLG